MNEPFGPRLAVSIFVAFMLLAVPIRPAASAEPGKWKSIPGPSRFFHTATAISPTKVLVAGGCESLTESGGCGEATAKTATFDQRSAKWKPTADMRVARFGHSAVLLPDGRLLALGGCSALEAYVCSRPANSAEVYDPAKDAWAILPGSTNMNLPSDSSVTRADLPGFFFLDFQVLQTTLIPQPGGAPDCGSACGKILVASSSLQWLLDPKTGASTLAKKYPGQFPILHTDHLLQDGRVLVHGADATIAYNPAEDSWAKLPPPTIARTYGGVTPLANGGILLTGGLDAAQSAAVGAVEHFVSGRPGGRAPAADAWKPARPMVTPRFGHTASRLSDGRVLVAGGSSKIGHALSAAEVYDPEQGRWAPAPPMPEARGGQTKGQPPNFAPTASSFTSSVLSDGTALVVGGATRKTSDLFVPAGISIPAATAAASGEERQTFNPWWALAAAAVFALSVLSALLVRRKAKVE